MKPCGPIGGAADRKTWRGLDIRRTYCPRSSRKVNRVSLLVNDFEACYNLREVCMKDVETTVTSTERKSGRTMMWIGIIAAAIVLAIIVGFVLMISAGVTGTVRDVIIIILALESLIVGALMLVLVVQVIALVKMMREEIKPLLQSAQDTLESTRGTTTFVSKKVIAPAIAVASTVAGVRRVIEFVIKRKR
jgi:hypothetical protein